MRKLSLLSILLVFGLMVSLVGVNVLAAEDNGTDPVNLERTNGALSLDVDSSADGGGTIDFDPTTNYDSTNPIGTTTLKVVSGGFDWVLSVDSSSPTVTTSADGANNTKIEEHFGISLDASNSDGTEVSVTDGPNKVEGGNGRYDVDYKYTWNSMSQAHAAQYMPNGIYEIEVTYTVASN